MLHEKFATALLSHNNVLTCHNKSVTVGGRYSVCDPSSSIFGGKVVTISCKLRLLLARANVERAKQGKASLSLRCLAKESGVSLSVLTALNTGKSQRIDYGTIDHLLNYFSAYFTVTTNDLLVWEHAGNKGSRKDRGDSEQPMSIEGR